MVVKCAKCEKKYKIDSSKITEKGVKITCPNCDNVFVVRKKAEEEEKEDFVPCKQCGGVATLDLETDDPICEQCKVKQAESAVRFVSMAEEDQPGAPFERELDLQAESGISFGDLSGGDFSPKAYSTEVLTGEGSSRSVPDESPSEAEQQPEGSTPQTESFVEAPHDTAASLPSEPTESFIESPNETAASLPTEPTESLIESPNETAAPLPTEPTESFIESPNETAASLPTDTSEPVVEAPPPPLQPEMKIPEAPVKEPTPPPIIREPTPPPATPPVVQSKPEPGAGLEEDKADSQKTSPIPLIITIVLTVAILFYLFHYVLKIF